MTRISHLALAACLVAALSSPSANAFIVPPAPHHARTGLLPMSSTAETADPKPSSLKRLPESAVELTLNIPSSATTAAYDKTLSEVAKNVNIPGFRKGAKIPPQVIENAWSKNGGRKALRTMAINELCGELIGPALKDDHDLEPIGNPSLVTPAEQLAEGFVPGQDLEVVVRCDVWPEIMWKKTAEDNDGKKQYLGLTGTYKRKPFDQAKFDNALRDLRERYVKLEPYDDDSHELAMGDACKVDMAGYMAAPDGSKGEPLPDAASGDGVEVVLGSGLYMEGLVEGLEGAKVGETRTVNVRFPDALKNKELAGKDAVFDVTVLSASRRILPEITDEFAAEVREGLTADSLRDELKKAVDSQDAQEYMGARNEALGKALSEIMDVDVPDTLVTNQAREKYAAMMTDMRDNGMPDEEIKKMINPENFVKYKDIAKPDIVRDFKVSMAVDEVARLENIQVPSYQVEEQMQSLKDQAAKEGQSTDDMDEEQMRRKVESTLERRAVYDFLAEAANLDVEFVEEEGFDEALMEKLAAESLAREEEAKSKDDDEGKQGEEVAAAAEPVAVAQAAVEVEEKPAPVAIEEEAPSPASAQTKEEDLELTTQVIMNYVNSQEADGDGVVDDDDE